ncbi:polyprotein [Oopsacas minuta]|uniref:Polyprotein n=1 Tax=Oopsacas minuta TaxID=111878 RepID=A0AAV7KFA9_9METZ|nr:polyprotein [Oopsacas minuta]
MAERFVSIPRVFASGDIEEWLQRYEICALANGLKEEDKALRIPTLLEKEALAVYLELSTEERKDYRHVRDTLLNAFQPPEARFIALQEFESRRMLPGESPQEFLHYIKWSLNKAIPEMDDGAREQLLLHRF